MDGGGKLSQCRNKAIGCVHVPGCHVLLSVLQVRCSPPRESAPLLGSDEQAVLLSALTLFLNPNPSVQHGVAECTGSIPEP